MSDTITASRVEPVLRPESGAATILPPGPPPRAIGEAFAMTAATSSAPVIETAVSSPSDQLARLEDKTARIEEKLARSEAATQRVVDRFETASHRMSEVAQQADLLGVKGEVGIIARRVKGLPGFSAVILSSVITAVLTAVLTVVIIRYLPGVMGR